MWNSGEYGEISVNYVAHGLERPGVPMLLVHGFGASAFHWRSNILDLALDRPVYAIDLVGFGLSDKPLVDYSAELWRDQVGAFLREVVQEPAVIAGNSLGGFAALYAAASFPERVAGCVLLNAAGRFSSPDDDAIAAAAAGGGTLLDSAKAWLQRFVITGSFYLTKQPQRIEQVLRQVYSVDDSAVDRALVESIRFAADSSPNCAEVFYRVVTRTSSPVASAATPSIDALLPLLTAAAVPLWLVWGESDPWIRPQVADRIVGLKPDAMRVSIDAGHCPHDEKPRDVNAALRAAGAVCDEVFVEKRAPDKQEQKEMPS